MKYIHALWGKPVLCLLPIGIFMLVTLTAVNQPPRESQQTGSWSASIVISTSPVTGTVYSWLPDMAVDEFGSVHVIWCETRPLPNSQLQEQVAYTSYTNTTWLPPNDIVPPSFDIVRNAIAADLDGYVDMIYGGTVHDKVLALYFTRARVNDAWSAQSWSPYIQINRGASYLGDIAVDSNGVIHVIYDDTVHYPGQATQGVFADIYYIKSADGGKTWSSPINLSNSPETGSARPYLKVDRNNIIHVTWDEGWDRLTGTEANTQYSVYTYSTDEGESWSKPKIISYPNGTSEQLTVGSTDRGSVILVWRSNKDQNLYYQVSNDGTTWSAVSTIPDLLARPWSIPFDRYDMDTDSNGNIHLIAVGQLRESDVVPGLYHIVWDGKEWSNLQQIFWQDKLFPEYPKIVISGGNQIHAVWFTREGDLYTLTNRQVWYSESKVDAPVLHIQSRPTPTLPSPTLTPIPGPSATPQPTISSAGMGTSSPTKEDEYLKIIAIALSPVFLLIIVVVIIKNIYNRLRG